jgi:aminoglycoside phosphotransferase (APT) family kinase protein
MRVFGRFLELREMRVRPSDDTADDAEEMWMPEWDAEVVVTPERARELIREQFPALGSSVQPLGSGWDNTAFLVDGALVFRFARREIAVRLMETEARVLPAIAPRLPLPIPVPEWVGKATERFPWPFAGYRRLPGLTADAAHLTGDDLRGIARELGAFLAALHAMQTDGLALPGDEHRRTDFVQRRAKFADQLAALHRAGIVADQEPYLRIYGDGSTPGPAPAPRLVHGDLYERHLLVDGGRISGVIDWGDVHADDPALDLSILFRLFPPAIRDEFLRAYGGIDARTERVARLRALFHVVVTTWFAHSTGDAALLASGRASLGYVLED